MQSGPTEFLWLLITGVVSASFIGVPVVTAWAGIAEIKRKRLKKGASLIALSVPLFIMAVWASFKIAVR